MLFVFFPGKILIMVLMCLSCFCVLRGLFHPVAAESAISPTHTHTHTHTHRCYPPSADPHLAVEARVSVEMAGSGAGVF